MKSQHIQQLVVYFYNWINKLDQVLNNTNENSTKYFLKAHLTTSIYSLKLCLKKYVSKQRYIKLDCKTKQCYKIK